MPWQGVPLMYVPLEVVMSKYYGESERLLGKVFSLANELPNGAIIFLDEVTDANMLTFVLSKQFILCFITNIPKWSSQMITFFHSLSPFQVDSFAVARDSEMHEATRRILSVLLRQVKLGFHLVLCPQIMSFLHCLS